MALFSNKKTNTPRRRQKDDTAVSEHTVNEERYSFRRNRTLTGSASSSVSSANESNSQLKSARVHAHDLVRKRRHIGGMLILIMVGALGLLFLISQFTATVAVRTKDASIQLNQAYEIAVQEYLAKKPVERLRFLLDIESLNKYVQSVTPEVESIKVEGSAGFGKSRFIATMREPIAGWSVNGKQQYVDAAGVSFERNYFPAPKVQIIDQSGIQVAAGQAVASNRFLGFVGLVVGLSKTQGYNVSQVIIPKATTRQIQLRIEGVGFPVTFSVDRGAGEQVEDMGRSITWLKEHSLTPEYLDVRISGKAFYK